MLSNLVMTIIGPDRPGLVREVSAALADHGGNWLESRMSHLGGQFAGIVRAEVASERAAALVTALQGLETKGLRVVVHHEAAAEAQVAVTTATLELVGHDRPGILRAVSSALAARGINVEELSSELRACQRADGRRHAVSGDHPRVRDRSSGAGLGAK